MCITTRDSVRKLLADVEFKINLEKEESENQLIERALKFLHSGCGCSQGAKGCRCSKQFEETVLCNLHNCIEHRAWLVVLASIQAFTRKEDIGSKRSRSPRCCLYCASQCLVCLSWLLASQKRVLLYKNKFSTTASKQCPWAFRLVVVKCTQNQRNLNWTD